VDAESRGDLPGVRRALPLAAFDDVHRGPVRLACRGGFEQGRGEAAGSHPEALGGFPANPVEEGVDLAGARGIAAVMLRNARAARPAVPLDKTFPGQRSVCMANRVDIDAPLLGGLAHGLEGVARGQFPRRDGRAEGLGDLVVQGNWAVGIDREDHGNLQLHL